MSSPVKTKEQIAQVATISAADAEIGNLIAEVMEKVGKDGVITVEESKGLQFETEFVEGMQFDRGYISRLFRHQCRAAWKPRSKTLTSSSTDKKISAIPDILPVLEKLLQVCKNLVIIAEDIEGEALATLVVNKLRGTLNCWPSKPPVSVTAARPCCEDIATLTGGKVISEEIGRKLDTAAIAGPRPRQQGSFR